MSSLWEIRLKWTPYKMTRLTRLTCFSLRLWGWESTRDVWFNQVVPAIYTIVIDSYSVYIVCILFLLFIICAFIYYFCLFCFVLFCFRVLLGLFVVVLFCLLVCVCVVVFFVAVVLLLLLLWRSFVITEWTWNPEGFAIVPMFETLQILL